MVHLLLGEIWVFDAGFSSGQITGGRLTGRGKKGGGTNISASYPFSLIREKRGKNPIPLLVSPLFFSDNDGFLL